MGVFSSKKPEQPAAAKPKAQTPLGMLKSKVDKGSTAGTLRDRKDQLDQQIKDAGG